MYFDAMCPSQAHVLAVKKAAALDKKQVSLENTGWTGILGKKISKN
jgi:hypothetical protein